MSEDEYTFAVKWLAVIMRHDKECNDAHPLAECPFIMTYWELVKKNKKGPATDNLGGKK